MCWIPGSARDCGRFRRWDGRQKTKDFKTYYPTSLLITGYDILVFLGGADDHAGACTSPGEFPFAPCICIRWCAPASGEKMSKSKGTGLDPVALNQQYGTDAMRFCLASMAAPGTDIVLSDDRLGGARNFANKIWNAARFLFVNLEKFEQGGSTLEELAAPEVRANAPYAFGGSVPLRDAWIFARLAATIGAVNEALANYRFHEAAQVIYQFFWGDFCDWYIEWVKPDLQNADRERAWWRGGTCSRCLRRALRLLHPVMPFLTEELWHQLPQRRASKVDCAENVSRREARVGRRSRVKEFVLAQNVILELRNIRAEMKLDPRKRWLRNFTVRTKICARSNSEEQDGIQRLAILSELKVSAKPLASDGRSDAVDCAIRYSIAYSDVVDVTAGSERLRKEIERLQKDIASKERQLRDETFRSRAPEKIIQGMQATLEERRIELGKSSERLQHLERGA